MPSKIAPTCSVERVAVIYTGSTCVHACMLHCHVDAAKYTVAGLIAGRLASQYSTTTMHRSTST